MWEISQPKNYISENTKRAEISLRPLGLPCIFKGSNQFLIRYETLVFVD
jgi:hypothetical protein